MFERNNDQIVIVAPKESKQKRSVSKDLNQHLTWLQKRLEETRYYVISLPSLNSGRRAENRYYL